MGQDNLPFRLLFVFFGLLAMSLGLAASMHAGLGTTPISTIPYVYNKLFPHISVGLFTIILNLLFFSVHLLFAEKRIKPIIYLQIPMTLILGFNIDVALKLLAHWTIDTYLMQLLLLIAAVLVFAFGVFLIVKSNTTMLPIEGFIMTISEKTERDFSAIKFSMELVFVAIALLSSVVLIKAPFGVREGTLLLTFATGFVILFYQKYFIFLDKLLEVEKKSSDDYLPEPYLLTDKFAITISRQFGSGGHEIGKMIAEKLNVGFYDSDLIELTAKEAGFSKEYVEKNEQKLKSNLFFKFYTQNYAFVNEIKPPKDLLFIAQTKVIRDIAAVESCVIVGRCADFILKGHPNVFNIFVLANEDFRIGRAINNYGIQAEKAKEELMLKDKERMNYNKHYTNRDWGSPQFYDMTIDSSIFGIEMSVAMAIDSHKKKYYS